MCTECYLVISDAELLSMATEDKPKENYSTADSALDTRLSMVTETTTEGSKFSEVSQPTTKYL